MDIQAKTLYESINKSLISIYEMAEYEIEIDEKLNNALIMLQAKDSERYTKLAMKLEYLRQTEKEVKEAKQEVKDLTKELIEDLFGAENEIYTRIVETVSAIFTLSKKPKETQTVQWKKVIDAFTEELTPELIEILEQLKTQYTVTSQKSAALRHKLKEYLDTETENVMQEIVENNRQFYNYIMHWSQVYDRKLQILNIN